MQRNKILYIQNVIKIKIFSKKLEFIKSKLINRSFFKTKFLNFPVFIRKVHFSYNLHKSIEFGSAIVEHMRRNRQCVMALQKNMYSFVQISFGISSQKKLRKMFIKSRQPSLVKQGITALDLVLGVSIVTNADYRCFHFFQPMRTLILLSSIKF